MAYFPNKSHTMKLIKFDLPINGIKVKNIDELRDNLTDELVTLARKGQLERWLKTRQRNDLVQTVAGALAINASDKDLFLAICTALDIQVHPDDVSALFDPPPPPGQKLKEGVFLSKNYSIDEDNKTPPQHTKHQKNIITEYGYILNPNKTIIDEKNGLMWKQEKEKETYTHIQARITFTGKHQFSGYHDWRLPTKDELESLIQKDGSEPYFDSIFPDLNEYRFWSSTIFSRDPTRAWSVYFGKDYGSNPISKTTQFRIRLVRNHHTTKHTFKSLSNDPDLFPK